MTAVTTHELRDWMREVRKKCPPIVPVRLRRRKLKGDLGYARMRWQSDGAPSHFLVVLDSRLPRDLAWHMLLHELAHCLAWQEGHETLQDHDALWGVALSRAYQTLHEP